ncbi:MAG: amidohydrolase family protein [Candidatus Solibacter usitatus]|nr:amidohydrolase family protein [Candidatus Solibacter usitatus]
MRAALLFALTALTAFAGVDDTFLIRGATVYPVSGPKMENASLLVVDGKIAEIGPKVTAGKTVKVIDGRGLHVYPGMIDSATEAGMQEITSVRETADINEIGDFKPQLRAVIAVNPISEHIPVIRANGITSVMVLPGGGIIAGQAGLIHLDGWTWEEMLIKRDAAMNLLFPSIGGGGGFSMSAGPTRVSFTESKRTYDRRIKQLKDYFESARRYQKAKTAGGAGFKIDLAFEAMIPVLEGKMPLIVNAVRERAIREAVDWATKENVKIVLAGVRKPGNTLADLKAKNIPVILGPTLTLPMEEDDPYDSPFTLPNELYKAGVKFAFGSFENQFSRNLPYQAGTAVGFGLPYEEALKSVTLNPAQIWGVDATLGSIDKGKWADLMITNGDPLEVRTEVKRLYVKGKEVDIDSRHTKLYKKYLARP